MTIKGCGKMLTDFKRFSGDQDCGVYCRFCKLIHYCNDCLKKEAQKK